MTADLRARIAAALHEHGSPTHGLPDDEFECCADAVMAVIEAEQDRWILDYLRTHQDETMRFMRAEMGRLAQRVRVPIDEEARIAAWYAEKYLKCASCGTPESVKPTVFRLPNGGGDLCAECAKPVIDSTRAIEEAIARKNEKAPAIREPEAGEQ